MPTEVTNNSSGGGDGGGGSNSIRSSSGFASMEPYLEFFFKSQEALLGPEGTQNGTHTAPKQAENGLRGPSLTPVSPKLAVRAPAEPFETPFGGSYWVVF